MRLREEVVSVGALSAALSSTFEEEESRFGLAIGPFHVNAARFWGVHPLPVIHTYTTRCPVAVRCWVQACERDDQVEVRCT